MTDPADLAALRQARAELEALLDRIDISSAATLPAPDLPYTRMGETQERFVAREGTGVPGVSWTVPHGPDRRWLVQVPRDRDDPEDDFVYVTTVDLFPDDMPCSSKEARLLARALLAAAAYRDSLTHL